MSQTVYSSKRLDHHGIVAGICKELGIAELVDQALPTSSCKKVSYGEVVVAMIINMMGFTSRPPQSRVFQEQARQPYSLRFGLEGF